MRTSSPPYDNNVYPMSKQNKKKLKQQKKEHRSGYPAFLVHARKCQIMIIFGNFALRSEITKPNPRLAGKIRVKWNP
jgi:hypothetical protein